LEKRDRKYQTLFGETRIDGQTAFPFYAASILERAHLYYEPYMDVEELIEEQGDLAETTYRR